MHRVVAFLLTTKPDEAIAFYRDTLGLTFVRNDGFALVFDTHGIQLRIAKVEQHTPAQSTVLGWETHDIAADVAALTAKGAQFQIYEGMGQDKQGIAAFPNGDKVAWFRDPDDNVLSLSQHV